MELGGLGSNSTSTMSQLCGLGQITQPLCSPHKLGVGGSYHNTSHMRAKHLNNSIKYLNSKGCGCCHPDYKSAPVSLEVNRCGPAACSCPLLSEPLSGGLVDPTRAGEGPWVVCLLSSWHYYPCGLLVLHLPLWAVFLHPSCLGHEGDLLPDLQLHGTLPGSAHPPHLSWPCNQSHSQRSWSWRPDRTGIS